MKISVPVKPAIDHKLKPRVKPAGSASPQAAPRTARCPSCHGTGDSWVQCRGAGPARIRCSCGASCLANGLMELRITALAAGGFTVVLLCVMYFLGNPSPIF